MTLFSQVMFLFLLSLKLTYTVCTLLEESNVVSNYENSREEILYTFVYVFLKDLFWEWLRELLYDAFHQKNTPGK